MKSIRYRDGYKYQLAEDFSIRTPFRPERDIETEFIILRRDGQLLIRRGYAWDGPSGPTFDSPSSMRGSLVHDALYQLMRLGLLPISCRPAADDLLYKLCVEDGMWRWRAWLWRREVRKFAAFAASPSSTREVKVAPAA